MLGRFPGAPPPLADGGPRPRNPAIKLEQDRPACFPSPAAPSSASRPPSRRPPPEGEGKSRKGAAPLPPEPVARGPEPLPPEPPRPSPEPPAPEPGGNLLSLGVIQGLRMGASMAVNVMAMRALGAEGFGVYGYVTTLVGVASFGASMGMDRLIKREMARDPGAAGRYVATALAATAGMSVLTAVGIVAWAWATDGRPMVLGAAALATLAVGLQALAVVPVSYFHAIRRMRLGVPGSMLGRLALVLGTAVLLRLGLGVNAVFSAQVLDAAVTFAVVWAVCRRELAGARLGTDVTQVRSLLKEAVPFGLNALFGSIYLSSDVILLGHMRGDAEVGVYRAAVMLMSLAVVLADTFSTGLYPKMARHLGQPDRAGEELGFATRMLLALSVPAAVGGMLTADRLLVLLGGSEFAASALPFVVMAPLLPLRFLNNGYGMTLSALDRQGDRTRGVFWAALFNVAANLVVIPAYGAVGAAATTLLTEVLLAVWMRWRITPLVTGLTLSPTLVRVGVPAVAMAAGMALLPPVHVGVSMSVGVVIYGAVGRLTGAWAPADLHQLRRV